LAFGSAWLALLGLSYLGRHVGRVEPNGLLVAGCSALILVAGLNIYRSHATDIDRYSV
jgi:undecaprenyl-diphosphatase